MRGITFPYPNWIMLDVEMAMEPLCIGLVMLYFSKDRIDDERIHYLKFQALASAMINGLILSWLITKFFYKSNYTVQDHFVVPISATLFVVVTIVIAYARLYYLKARL